MLPGGGRKTSVVSWNPRWLLDLQFYQPPVYQPQALATKAAPRGRSGARGWMMQSVSLRIRKLCQRIPAGRKPGGTGLEDTRPAYATRGFAKLKWVTPTAMLRTCCKPSAPRLPTPSFREPAKFGPMAPTGPGEHDQRNTHEASTEALTWPCDPAQM